MSPDAACLGWDPGSSICWPYDPEDMLNLLRPQFIYHASGCGWKEEHQKHRIVLGSWYPRSADNSSWHIARALVNISVIIQTTTRGLGAGAVKSTICSSRGTDLMQPSHPQVGFSSSQHPALFVFMNFSMIFLFIVFVSDHKLYEGRRWICLSLPT